VYRLDAASSPPPPLATPRRSSDGFRGLDPLRGRELCSGHPIQLTLLPLDCAAPTRRAACDCCTGAWIVAQRLANTPAPTCSSEASVGSWAAVQRPHIQLTLLLLDCAAPTRRAACDCCTGAWIVAQRLANPLAPTCSSAPFAALLLLLLLCCCSCCPPAPYQLPRCTVFSDIWRNVSVMLADHTSLVRQIANRAYGGTIIDP
jgi:hypothetical protein